MYRNAEADAAVIILYNDVGEMLFEHHTETRKRWPGYWALFGGRPEPGETPLQNVLREAKEELGYTLTDPVLILTQQLDDGSVKHVFAEKFDAIQHITLNPHESQGAAWLTRAELEQRKHIPHDIAPVRKVCEYIQQQL